METARRIHFFRGVILFYNAVAVPAHSKVLVRRTGDHVMAAVDEQGLYACNNFFLVFPSRECGLDLHGLCALLNSHFMTWYFRCIEGDKSLAASDSSVLESPHSTQLANLTSDSPSQARS